MIGVLKLSGDSLSVIARDETEGERLVTDADALEEFGSSAVVIVLEDPSYLSNKQAVELKSRRDRKKMAGAIFSKNAGSNGYGSWVIAPHHDSIQLFSWAVDPSSLEWKRLNSLSASDLNIVCITTQLICAKPAISNEPHEAVLRVICTEHCVQLALMLAGQWVFTRRVDTLSTTTADAIESTLNHLHTREYINDRRELCWELSARQEVLLELSPLWTSKDALMPEPLLSPILDWREYAKPAHCLNTVASWPTKTIEKRDLKVSIVGFFSAALLVAFLLPFVMLSKSIRPAFHPPPSFETPMDLQRRHWQLLNLQDQKIVAPSVVASDSGRLLAAIEQDKNLNLLEFSVETDASYRLRAELLIDSKSPLEKRLYLSALGKRLSLLLPGYQAKVQVSREYSIGGPQAASAFDLLLERNDVAS